MRQIVCGLALLLLAGCMSYEPRYDARAVAEECTARNSALAKEASFLSFDTLASAYQLCMLPAGVPMSITSSSSPVLLTPAPVVVHQPAPVIGPSWPLGGQLGITNCQQIGNQINCLSQ